MTREEMIEQLENTILLIEQNGKDWFDERDIPILEAAIKAMKMEPCEDCISRQDVLNEIEIVCFSKTWAKFRADYGSNGTRDYIINYIKQLPPVQPEQRWIPTSERLPESDCETVLVTGKMKYASEKEYEYFVDCAFVGSIHGTPDNFSPFDFETWNDWYEGQDEYYILAWMPLPEPWKAESEDKK